MPSLSSADHRFHVAVRWRPEEPAERVTERIVMSKANSNRYLIETSEGDLLINTGVPAQAVRHRERYEQLLGRELATRVTIFTQSHPDHYSGWEVYGEDAETIAHSSFPEGVLDRQRLAAFFTPRRDRTTMWGRPASAAMPYIPDAVIRTSFDRSHAFELGGLSVELHSLPGGETRDSIAVWLPEERTIFTGNHGGALYGALPNLTTIRGDRLRSARQFMLDVDFMLALEPELLITGHDDPIRGAATIRADFERIRDAIGFIEQATVDGMNAGHDLWTLMATIALPPALEPAPGRCPVRWLVRSVWEEYTGWFRFESPGELSATPPHAVWPDLATLAGGPDPLAERAAAHLAAGRPDEAIHLTDIALTAEPRHRAALETRADALAELLRRTAGLHYDEVTYLESELAVTGRSLGLEPAS